MENGIFVGFNSCSSSQENFLDQAVNGQSQMMGLSTVQEAIVLLHGILTEDEKREIANTAREDLIAYHFSLGRWIRNSFDLWAEDSELLKALGSIDPDDASMVLMEKYWESLQT